ncbi:amino acid ABC transporter permease [Ensifer sp. YR511]|uniref:amino acid ABC transporter permease n=1 Tax=Ensifer sp. YR511 TaxID=1855294 RepID=UPI000885927A|nr:amino acid ABC transporter permease [Ensifer sp. YR511]SDO23234.1 amino acid ABC transporter membrane protein 1, PAAT family [Ensifer sp. YR511]
MTDVTLLSSGLYLAQGAAVTLGLSLATILVAAGLGLPLALVGLYAWAPLRVVAAAYGLAVRGVPLLVLLVGSYFSLPYLGVDLPLSVVVVLVGGLYFAAYAAEVFRAALAAMPKQQWDAGRALGMRRLQLFTIVILPQARRLSTAPFVNVALVVVKNTSLVSAIGGWELVAAGREIGERSMDILPAYLAVAAFYFVICFTLSRIGHQIEQRTHHG